MSVLSLLLAASACPFHKACGGIDPCSITKAALRDIASWPTDPNALRSMRARNKNKRVPGVRSRPFGKTRAA